MGILRDTNQWRLSHSRTVPRSPIWTMNDVVDAASRAVVAVAAAGASAVIVAADVAVAVAAAGRLFAVEEKRKKCPLRQTNPHHSSFSLHRRCLLAPVIPLSRSHIPFPHCKLRLPPPGYLDLTDSYPLLLLLLLFPLLPRLSSSIIFLPKTTLRFFSFSLASGHVTLPRP